MSQGSRPALALHALSSAFDVGLGVTWIFLSLFLGLLVSGPRCESPLSKKMIFFPLQSLSPPCFHPLTEIRLTVSKFIRYGISFNMYMFHGGTNFGFINGAENVDQHRGVVTSYGK